VADRGDADGLVVVGELVDDAVGADAQRSQAAQAAAERVPGERFALENTERAFDSVDQWPARLDELATRCARKNYSRHRSACGA